MDTETLIGKIREAVLDYIAGEEAYGDDAQLVINTLTWQTDIADPEQDLPDCDYYPVMDLVRMDAVGSGRWEPDEEALESVAEEYVFTE